MMIDWPHLGRSLALAVIFAGLFVYFYPRAADEGLEPLHVTKDDCRVMLREGSTALRFPG